MTAVLAVTVSLAMVGPAAAASHHLVVDSLASSGRDVSPGDGSCATSTGTCTLRAAIEEANALGAGPGDVTITVAPGLAGSIRTTMTNTSANWMQTSAVTSWDRGAFYEITAPVTIDLDNRVSLVAPGDSPTAAVLHVNGPDVNLLNFTDVLGSGTSIVMGPNAARVTVEGGSTVTAANYYPERFVVYRQGAQDITVRSYHLQGFYHGGRQTTGLFLFNATSAEPMRNIVIDDVDITYPTASTTCNGNNGAGCRTNLTTFSPRSSAVFLDGFTFTNSRVAGLSSGRLGFKFADNGSNGVNLSNLDISHNEFLNTVGDGTGPENAFIMLPHRWLPGTNRIVGNTFVSAGSGQDVAISWDGVSGTVDAKSLTISDNHFDGFRTTSVRLYRSGTATVTRNTFGTRSASQGRPATSEETASSPVLLDNEGAAANGGIRTWYPTADATVLATGLPAGTLTVDAPQAEQAAARCTVTVPVQRPTAGTVPGEPVTLDAYWTADRTAELYLGSVSGVTGASATLAVDLPVGTRSLPGTAPGVTVPATAVDATTGAVSGNLRLQTQVQLGDKLQSSQYSRVVPVTGSCQPVLTIDQATDQNDPTLGRDLHFTVRSSLPLDPATLTTAGVQVTAEPTDQTIDPALLNPRVVAVTSVPGSDDTEFDVVVRVDDSAVVRAAVPAGTVTSLSGLTNTVAATSTDDQITFVNPLIAVPSRFSLVAGDPDGQDYQLRIRDGAPPPTADLLFQATVDAVGQENDVLLSTDRPVIPADATTSERVTVTAGAGAEDVPDDTVVTIAHTVTTQDGRYDGLVAPPVTPHLFAVDPAVLITEHAYVGVTDDTTPESVEATGTRVLPGARLTERQQVCFVYTVTNTSADDWATVLTDVVVMESDTRLGDNGLIGVVPVLQIGESRKFLACTSLLPLDTTIVPPEPGGTP